MDEEKKTDMQKFLESFPARVKARRAELKLTQEELAILVWPEIFSDANMSEKARDTKRKCIVGYENGKFPKDPDVYFRLCEALHCDIGYLFGERECSTKEIQGVKDYTGLSAESIELLSKLNNDPEGVEIVHEIDGLILDRRVIRCLHDIRIIVSGIMRSEITDKNASSIRAMLEVAILKLSTLSNLYAYDELNAESAMNRLNAAGTKEKTNLIY